MKRILFLLLLFVGVVSFNASNQIRETKLIIEVEEGLEGQVDFIASIEVQGQLHEGRFSIDLAEGTLSGVVPPPYMYSNNTFYISMNYGKWTIDASSENAYTWDCALGQGITTGNSISVEAEADEIFIRIMRP